MINDHINTNEGESPPRVEIEISGYELDIYALKKICDVVRMYDSEVVLYMNENSYVLNGSIMGLTMFYGANSKAPGLILEAVGTDKHKALKELSSVINTGLKPEEEQVIFTDDDTVYHEDEKGKKRLLIAMSANDKYTQQKKEMISKNLFLNNYVIHYCYLADRLPLYTKWNHYSSIRDTYENALNESITAVKPNIVFVHIGSMFDYSPYPFLSAISHAKWKYPKIIFVMEKIVTSMTDAKWHNLIEFNMEEFAIKEDSEIKELKQTIFALPKY